MEQVIKHNIITRASSIDASALVAQGFGVAIDIKVGLFGNPIETRWVDITDMCE